MYNFRNVLVAASSAFLLPAPASAETLSCTGQRICYDTIPCSAVDDPAIDYCRDRLTCDAIEGEVSQFDLIFDQDIVVRRGPIGQNISYNILSAHLNEFTSREFTHYTLVAEPPASIGYLSSIIYLEQSGEGNSATAEFVTVDLSVDKERGTITVYGNCNSIE